jgi:decaprenyl-phosphate phosphoribosyltransferase
MLRAMRPKQWLKNVLVLAAPGAAGVILHHDVAWRVALTLAAFCATASALYLRNDIADLESDRQHPRKRQRAIAAGVVPVSTARTTSWVLGTLGVGLAAATWRWQVVVAVAVYVVLTTAYTLRLKHVAVIDLLAVAAGFVVRAAAGASAAAVPVSNWFLICTSFGSLFVVTAKRFAEQSHLGDDAGGVRPTLELYTVGFLRMVIGVCLAVTSVAYCLWAFEKAAAHLHRVPWYELSIVPMVGALLRYALEVEAGAGDAPEELFSGDRTLQVLGAVWAALFALGVYVH